MVVSVHNYSTILERFKEQRAQILHFLLRDIKKRLYWRNTSVGREEFIALVTREANPRKITELLEELMHSSFFQELTKKMSPLLTKVRTSRGWLSYGLITDHGVGDFGAILYVITRLLKPLCVIKTGVANGASSAFILGAMEMNKRGRLYSIDLPAKKGEYFDDGAGYIIPAGKNIGWLVPKRLRGRWTLILEPAEKSLPRLVQHVGAIDVFLHDSLHTYDHMTFEYSTVWPYLRKGGILLSDDLFDHRNALLDFASKARRPLFHYDILGAIIK